MFGFSAGGLSLGVNGPSGQMVSGQLRGTGHNHKSPRLWNQTVWFKSGFYTYDMYNLGKVT